MSSETEIANKALSLINVKSINALSETSSKEAREINLIFYSVLDEILEEPTATWSFSTKTTSLAKLTDTPLYKWTYIYQLPTDMLRIIEIVDSNGYYIDKWERQGMTILCDTDSPIYLKYVYRPTNVVNLTPIFVECFAAKLAAKLANKLTSDKGAQDRSEILYEKTLKKSVLADANNSLDDYSLTYEEIA